MKFPVIKISISLFLYFICNFQIARADLPVHCLAFQIEGEWKFYLDQGGQKQQPACGHERPDKNTDHIDSFKKQNFQTKSVIKLKLKLPDEVYDENNKKAGRWTMIYDEGFEIFYKNQNFFAFSRYKTINNKIPKDDDDEQTKGYKSLCDQTFIGWYHNELTNSDWGCYYGEKVVKNTNQQNLDISNGEQHMKIVQRDDLVSKGKTYRLQQNSPNMISQNIQLNQQQDGPIQFSEVNIKQQERPLDQEESQQEDLNQQGLYQRFKQQKKIYEIPHTEYLDYNKQLDNQEFFKPDYSFIELINNIKTNSPWKARDHEHFKNMTHSQMQKMLGMSRFKQYKISNVIGGESSSNQESQQNKMAISMLQTDTQMKYKYKLKTKQDYLQQNGNEQNQQFNNNYNQQTYNTDENNNNFYTNNNSQENESQRFSQLNLGSSYNTIHQQESEQMQISFDQCSKEIDPKTDIPKCFDWRNYKGVNYDTPIKKQGECGSCYSVATLSALESRIRIKSKMRHKPFLSISGSISCSRYNQGCNGGYPILVAKQGKDMGFFDESCSPYTERDNTCKDQCYNQRLWKIDKYGYVGDNFYGSTNETTMMKEIIDNGPIVVAINAAPDLYYYNTGVFITNPTNLEQQSNNHPRMNKWIFTNHAVTCVGWGETIHDNEVLKYWILKNSWGEEWGEKGYFKMLKGVNLAAVENQAVYTTPLLEDDAVYQQQNKNFKFLKKKSFE